MTSTLIPLLSPLLADAQTGAAQAANHTSLFVVVGGILGGLSFLITSLLSMWQMGWFARPQHLVVSDWHRQDGRARFSLRLENKGNVPVTFQSFEVLHPRLRDAFGSDGEFALTDGAELYDDGRRVGLLHSRQEFHRIERSALHIELAPHGARTEVFEVDVLDGGEPILVFRDNYGNRFHCDAQGTHLGRWPYPYQMEYLAALGVDSADEGVMSSRSLFHRWSYASGRLGQ